MPLPPSTLIWSPGCSCIACVAAADDGGMLSSRGTMAAWDRGAPTSVTTAAAPGKIGVQPTLVTVVTRMSPSLSWPASSGLLISRATPWARPDPADGGSNRPRISAG